MPRSHPRNERRHKIISWHPPCEGPSKSSWKTLGLSGLVIWLLKSHYKHQQQFVNIISSHPCSPAVIWSHLLLCHCNPRGTGLVSHPSFYLTAAGKSYKAVSLKTWILLSDTGWASACSVPCSHCLPTQWAISTPYLDKNECCRLQTFRW